MTGRSAFTLIELGAVLAILSILAVFLATQIGTADEVVQAKLVRAQLEEISAALAHYENEQGDFPPSSFGGAVGAAPNAANTGSERLVLALWSDGLDGCGISPDDLQNVDGDETTAQVSELPTRDLFELADAWGNPIAYFHHTDYGRTDVYQTIDPGTGERIEGRVTAGVNPKTKLFYEHRRFQLLSAGSDGLFGTEDDLGNFKK
jgi:prepilin-type N-terminal cleavage/methylation domain-containing protein